MTTRRERLHTETMSEIKAIAREHMAAEGNQALSLRAIAREMEMTAPALYRYFASRDDLITALILDAFNGFADAMAEADAEAAALHGQAAFGKRLYAVMRAYRGWAIANPTEFALIYGTPIPDYHAPSEQTSAASARGLQVLFRVVVEAALAGTLSIPSEYQDLPPSIEAAFRQLSERNQYPVHPEAFYSAMMIWTHLHGHVMLELFEHSTPVVRDTEALYLAELNAILSQYGLTKPPD